MTLLPRRMLFASWPAVVLLAAWFAPPNALGQKDAKDAAPPPLVTRCDRNDAIYKVGEKAKFLLTSTIAEDGSYRLSEDGVGTISEGKIKFKPGQVYSLTGTLTKPGFLQLRVQQGKEKALA